MTAVAGATPGIIKPLVQLLSVAAAPQGTRVVGTLQRRTGPHGAFGLTFELTDLRGESTGVLDTIWEPPPPINPPTGEPAEGGSKPRPTRIQRLLGWFRSGIATIHRLVGEEGAAADIAGNAAGDTVGATAVGEEPGDAPATGAKGSDTGKRPEGEPSAESCDERFRRLLPLATRWLALELYRREAIARYRFIVPRFPPFMTRGPYESAVHNFVGVFKQSQALGIKHKPLFLEAAADFEQAVASDPWSPLPRVNLGDTYRLMRYVAAKAAEKAEYQTRALSAYAGARAVVGGWGPSDADVTLRLDLGTASALLHLAIAASEVRTEGAGQENADGTASVLTADAKKDAGDGGAAEEQLISDARECIRTVEDVLERAPGRRTEARLFYNLACWYGVADAQGKLGLAGTKEEDLGPGERARCYLACALARDPRYFWWAGNDSDLESIRKKDDGKHSLDRLQVAILTTQARENLQALPDGELRTRMESVLRDTGWLESSQG